MSRLHIIEYMILININDINKYRNKFFHKFISCFIKSRRLDDLDNIIYIYLDSVLHFTYNKLILNNL